MKSIRMQLDADADYSEPALNALLEDWKATIAPEIDVDVTTLRRLLVDYGELDRTPDCSQYRLGYPPRPAAFDLEVEWLDLRATVAAYRDAQRRRKRPPKELGRRPRR